MALYKNFDSDNLQKYWQALWSEQGTHFCCSQKHLRLQHLPCLRVISESPKTHSIQAILDQKVLQPFQGGYEQQCKFRETWWPNFCHHPIPWDREILRPPPIKVVHLFMLVEPKFAYKLHHRVNSTPKVKEDLNNKIFIILQTKGISTWQFLHWWLWHWKYSSQVPRETRSMKKTVLLKLSAELRWCSLGSTLSQVCVPTSQSIGNADDIRAQAIPNFLQQIREQS